MQKKDAKTKLKTEFGIHEKDTGSPGVQIALLSGEIDRLVAHLKHHPKDEHSRRGLIGMVVKRKKLLAYLKKTDEKRHDQVVKKIGLKK